MCRGFRAVSLPDFGPPRRRRSCAQRSELSREKPRELDATRQTAGLSPRWAVADSNKSPTAPVVERGSTQPNPAGVVDRGSAEPWPQVPRALGEHQAGETRFSLVLSRRAFRLVTTGRIAASGASTTLPFVGVELQLDTEERDATRYRGIPPKNSSDWPGHWPSSIVSDQVTPWA